MNITALVVSETNITLTWSNGFDGNAPITETQVDYYAEGEDILLSMMSNTSGNLTTLTLMDLMPLTLYNISVVVINIAGTSDPGYVLISTLSNCKY